MAAVTIKNSENFLLENDKINPMDIAYRLQELQERLAREEDAHANLNQNKKKLEGEAANLRKEIEDLQLVIQKVGAFSFLLFYKNALILQ